MPPRKAPGSEPSPPSTTMTKERMAGMAPTWGSQEKAWTSSAPASAAIMPPSAKASMFIRSGLMPAMAAASRSWLTARRALPVQVRCRK